MNGTRTCSVEECPHPLIAKGFCMSHWRYNKLYGSPHGRFPKVPDLDRLLASIDKTDDCWLWTGRLDRQGYGEFSFGGKYHRAHRISYELHVAPIPKDMAIDHLCRVRNCVNPAHLEIVTHGENARRAAPIRVLNHPACVHGHEFTEANTLRSPARGRVCRTCRNLRNKAWEMGMSYAEYRELTAPK